MKYIRRICCGFLIFLAANIPLLKYLLISKDIIIPKFGGIILMLLLVVGVIVINIVPALSNRRIPGKRTSETKAMGKKEMETKASETKSRSPGR